MTEYSEKLRRMTVRVTSPDGRIRAEASVRRPAVVSFASPAAHGEYRRPEDLTAAVSTVLTSAAAALERGRRMLLEQYTNLTADVDTEPDPELRAFLHARAAVTAEGESPDRRIRVSAIGLREWTVRLRPTSRPALSAGAFRIAVNSAVTDVHRAHAEAVHRLLG